MDCLEAQALMHGYLDKELDIIRAIAVEEHLRACTACQETYHAHDAARSAIQEHATYYRAPDHLRERIRSALPRATKHKTTTGTLSLTWFNFSASLAFAAVLAMGLTLYLALPSQKEGLTDEVIAAHVRSLMVDHLADIASSDQHTVKPWFNGKLNFSPPVTDLATQGFPLAGGRLDYIHDRPAAALVYRHRQHVINLFLWPAVQQENVSPQTLSRQGYNLVHWRQGGIEFWAISDLNLPELRQLVALLEGDTVVKPGS
jgi:anti-sigma factor RsiW